MKRSLLTIGLTALLISGILLPGCAAIVTETPGPLTTREYDFVDFDTIDIGYAFKLEVTPSDTYSVSIVANEGDFEHIKVTLTGNKLEIGMDKLFFHLPRSPKVIITMPGLRGLHMSGASEGVVTEFKSSNDFDLSLSGASELEMDLETGAFDGELSGASELAGRLTAARSDFELSGASEIELEGTGGDTRLDFSGASEADLEYFTVNDAEVHFSGASEASLEINGRLDVELSGASTLYYIGNPTLGDMDISGGSSLKRR